MHRNLPRTRIEELPRRFGQCGFRWQHESIADHVSIAMIDACFVVIMTRECAEKPSERQT